MSKSLGNIYTLQDILDKGYDLEAFKLLVLSKHYSTEGNFTWENLEAAQNRLNEIRAWADLRHQPSADTMPRELDELFRTTREDMLTAMQDNLNSPAALVALGKLMDYMSNIPIPGVEGTYTDGTLQFISDLIGIDIAHRPDITNEQKQLIKAREAAREAKDWTKSDELRDLLREQGIEIKDTPHGTVWSRAQ
ncbi:hypothetical protein E6P97_00640 [Patescibacteria group bacterium]|nr:MAG: hypothetical protein E6P97_00640 [Patescibacteria group bacterium]